MKIKALVSVAGDGFSLFPGQTVDVEAGVGKMLVAAGHAVEVKAVKRQPRVRAIKK